MPAGRPSKYTQELADELCERLSEGKSLRTVCEADDMPSKATVFSWLRTKPEFLDQYDRSKAEAADSLVDEILEISDDTSLETQRARLQVDARKWVASKLKPKKYGDKMNIGGDPDNPIRASLQVEFIKH